MLIAALALALAYACVCMLMLLRHARRLRATLDELRESAGAPHRSRVRGRQAFSEELSLELARIARTGRPACLVAVSMGGANRDPEGAHAAGTALAESVRASLRYIDRVYRIGVAELAVILPETRALGGLIAARRLEQRVADTSVGRITAGVAEAGPGIDANKLFRHAYCALLAAGRDGRPAVLDYSLELDRSGRWLRDPDQTRAS